MSSPKVDVIIPAYNQGHYLKESVESALAQTWQNIEVIIIDDGSTDDTSMVGQSFADPRVTYIFQDNKGLSAARNTGLERSSGEFVSFLDSDDLFLPEKIEKLLALFEKDPELGMGAGNALLIDENGSPLGKSYGDGVPESPEEWLFGNRIHVGSVLVKKSWLDQVEPFDVSLKACEDWDMWLRLAMLGCKMRWLPDIVSKYRVHGHQMTRETERMKSAMFAVLDKTFKHAQLPSTWQAVEAEARSAALVKAAARAFLAGDNHHGKADLTEAVRINPRLARDRGDELIQTLLGWAFAPSSADPLDYMTRVFDNLPADLEISTKYKKDQLGQLAEDLAFKNHAQGQIQQSRHYVVETLKIDPARLINRKLCGIYIKSLLLGT